MIGWVFLQQADLFELLNRSEVCYNIKWITALDCCKDDVQVMCDDRALTVRTLGQWNLLDACPIPTGKHLHLTQVLVELPIWPTNWLPIITAVPVASAALKLLLLQTAKNIVALVRLHKTYKTKQQHAFKRLMDVGCLWIVKGVTWVSPIHWLVELSTSLQVGPSHNSRANGLLSLTL